MIDHILVAEECEYLDREVIERVIGDITAAIRLLNGYIKYLSKRKKEEKSVL